MYSISCFAFIDRMAREVADADISVRGIPATQCIDGSCDIFEFDDSYFVNGEGLLTLILHIDGHVAIAELDALQRGEWYRCAATISLADDDAGSDIIGRHAERTKRSDDCD